MPDDLCDHGDWTCIWVSAYFPGDAPLRGLGVLIAGLRSLPESPRWLYRHDRPDEALQVLCDVYDMAPADPKVVSESSGILEAIELETLHGEYKWSQILKRDEVQTGKRVLLAYGIQFMNQMGGINLVVVSPVRYSLLEGP